MKNDDLVIMILGISWSRDRDPGNFMSFKPKLHDPVISEAIIYDPLFFTHHIYLLIDNIVKVSRFKIWFLVIHKPRIMVKVFRSWKSYEPCSWISWSHDYDPRKLMISWLWSEKNRDIQFLDHEISWSHDYDLGKSMIRPYLNF